MQNIIKKNPKNSQTKSLQSTPFQNPGGGTLSVTADVRTETFVSYIGCISPASYICYIADKCINLASAICYTNKNAFLSQ